MASEYLYPSNYYRKQFADEVDLYKRVKQSKEDKLYGGDAFNEWLELELTGLRADESEHQYIDWYIRYRWGLTTPAIDCYNLALLSQHADIPFEDILKMVNSHEIFKSAEARVLHIQRVKDIQRNAKSYFESNVFGKGKALFDELVSWFGTVGDAHEKAYEEFQLQQILEEPEYNPTFCTAGFTKLVKAIRPLQAPALRQQIYEDYLFMQKDLGIPTNEEGIEEIFIGRSSGGATKNTFHVYGMLATQYMEKHHPDWNKKKMGWYHFASRHTEPISKVDDTEFFIFASATNRLRQIDIDQDKIFSLLIFLFEEYANDKEWYERWNQYVDLDGCSADEFKAGHFASHLLEVSDFERKHWSSRHSLTQLQELLDAENLAEYRDPPEFLKEDSFRTTDSVINDRDYSTWDTFIRDKYFS